MKIYAQIIDGLISNRAKFQDDADIPKGWINVTGIVCNLGNPVVNGSPVSKPSRWHTLDDLTWIITQEDQDKKDAHDSERQRVTEIEVKKADSGLHKVTIAQATNFIENKIDNAANLAEMKTALKDILNRMVAFIL